MKDYDFDRVLSQLEQSKDAEWSRESRPTFLRKSDPAARDENLRRYVTGYPWIVIAKDKGNYYNYYCAICMKVANTYHLLSKDHVNRTVYNFADQLGRYIPEWMGRFNGVNTNEVLSEYATNIWPPMCDTCNLFPLDSHPSKCGPCLTAGGPLPRGAGGRADSSSHVDSSKRTRFSDPVRDTGRERPDMPVKKC